jgi:hypothetical protein
MNELSGSDGRNTAPHSDTTIVRTAPVEAVDKANEPTRIVITPHEGDDPTDLSSLPTDILKNTTTLRTLFSHVRTTQTFNLIFPPQHKLQMT